MQKIVVPAIGEGITNATVSYWFFKAGDRVNKNDELVELTTDKAAFNVASPSAGTLTKVLVAEGQSANVGETLGIIE
jgi:2-oxoglutarate dehydrogenase E2 component (dihydrolipoamide succinyltransferase)